MTPSSPSGGFRLSEAEREECRHALNQHFHAGRLDPDEYHDRMVAVSSARFVDDLRPAFVDLPHPRPTVLAPPGEQGPPTPFIARQLQGKPHPPGAAAGYPVAGGGWPPAAQQAPYGVQPGTGRPYSDKQKVAAGLLQIFLGCFGVGRFYTGHTGMALTQLLLTVLTFGFATPVTALWGVIDGVLMLTDNVDDRHGRPLR